MEMELTISLTVSIAEDGANINEICAAVKDSVVKTLAPTVAEQTVEGIQEHILELLSSAAGRQAKRGLGGHPVKGSDTNHCRYRAFTRQGYRPGKRRLKTDIGNISFTVGYLECRGCGKRLAPILDVLDIKPREGHSPSLELMASEVISATSYQRGEDEISARGSPPVPRSSAHRRVAGHDFPEGDPQGMVTGMADGTGFKKWPGKKGDLRVVIGLDSAGKPHPLGTYAGESWADIAKEVRERLEEKEVQLKLFTVDGEIGLDRHLAKAADDSQRCVWRLPRDLGYALWEDGVPLEERKKKSGELFGMVGIEVPEGDLEMVSPEEKEELKEEISRREDQIEDMVEDFRSRGYRKAATYLENATGKVFSHLYLWLETGIVAPRTTSILENIMRELGRRVKKLGWNWTDQGITRVAKIIMLRRYEKEQWDAYWKEFLCLKGRCSIAVNSIERKAA
ncbi:MAG: hypothetical protein KKB90_08955 [Actinobacteria bacterium]|nr:hypothetical protein [Actinomycetota bacterium]